MTNVHSKEGGGGGGGVIIYKSTRLPNELNNRTNNEFVRYIVESITTVD